MIAEMPLSLADLRVAETGRVRMLTGPAGLRQRLGEMGLTAGSPVRLVRVAPFGDPIEIDVRDYHLCLRREEGRCVLIERFDGTAQCACAAAPALDATTGDAALQPSETQSAKARKRRWLQGLGVCAFMFFAIKGLLWLLVPLALVSYKYLVD
ncbi:MAG TPA: FeoA family protein [Phycisphaerae bacterium]|nr:FeoA family protein [Phycisphaerae bacterium]